MKIYRKFNDGTVIIDQATCVTPSFSNGTLQGWNVKDENQDFTKEFDIDLDNMARKGMIDFAIMNDGYKYENE